MTLKATLSEHVAVMNSVSSAADTSFPALEEWFHRLAVASRKGSQAVRRSQPGVSTSLQPAGGAQSGGLAGAPAIAAEPEVAGPMAAEDAVECAMVVRATEDNAMAGGAASGSGTIAVDTPGGEIPVAAFVMDSQGGGAVAAGEVAAGVPLPMIGLPQAGDVSTAVPPPDPPASVSPALTPQAVAMTPQRAEWGGCEPGVTSCSDFTINSIRLLEGEPDRMDQSAVIQDIVLPLGASEGLGQPQMGQIGGAGTPLVVSISTEGTPGNDASAEPAEPMIPGDDQSTVMNMSVMENVILNAGQPQMGQSGGAGTPLVVNTFTEGTPGNDAPAEPAEPVIPGNDQSTVMSSNAVIRNAIGCAIGNNVVNAVVSPVSPVVPVPLPRRRNPPGSLSGPSPPVSPLLLVPPLPPPCPPPHQWVPGSRGDGRFKSWQILC